MPKQISENKRNMILNGNLSQAILMLAVPVMINSFIQSMYNLTDTFWLGRIGTENQSAITLVSPFQNILNSFGSGITTAGAILISQYLGARKDEQANKMANHICITSLGFSLICALLCWLISPALVTWLGARGVVYEYGLTYLRIVVLDMPFLFMINLFTAVKQAQGDTVKPMLLNLLPKQMLAGNMQLLILRIAGNFNQLHAIQQGPRYSLNRIGCGDEQNFG